MYNYSNRLWFFSYISYITCFMLCCEQPRDLLPSYWQCLWCDNDSCILNTHVVTAPPTPPPPHTHTQSMFAAQMGILHVTGGRKTKQISKLDQKTIEKMGETIEQTNTNSRCVWSHDIRSHDIYSSMS